MKGPSSRLALAFLAVGLMALVAAAFVVGPRLLAASNSPRFEVPGSHHLHLDDGQWVLYERIGRTTDSENAGKTLDNLGPVIEPGQVVIDGPNAELPQPTDGGQTMRLNGDTYVAAVQFEVLDGGQYTIQVNANTAEGEVAVARPTSDLLRDWPWLVAGALGAVAVLAGVVMWLIGAVNRQTARRAGAG